jgi:hypothetical protein
MDLIENDAYNNSFTEPLPGNDKGDTHTNTQGSTIPTLVCVCVCVCVCGGKDQLVSECPLESPPGEGECPVVVRPLPPPKRRPHFKTSKSLRKNKNMVMGPDGTRNQDLLC